MVPAEALCAICLLRDPDGLKEPLLVLGSPVLVDDPKMYLVEKRLSLKLGFKKRSGLFTLGTEWVILSCRTRKILLSLGTGGYPQYKKAMGDFARVGDPQCARHWGASVWTLSSCYSQFRGWEDFTQLINDQGGTKLLGRKLACGVFLELVALVEFVKIKQKSYEWFLSSEEGTLPSSPATASSRQLRNFKGN